MNIQMKTTCSHFVYIQVEIVQALQGANFFILTSKMSTLTAEQAAQLAHAHHGKEYYDEWIHYMTR
jgi:nucleoside diphosphate kinase